MQACKPASWKSSSSEEEEGEDEEESKEADWGKRSTLRRLNKALCKKWKKSSPAPEVVVQ